MAKHDLSGTWIDKLLVTPTRAPRPVFANALVAFREAPEWAGVLAYDDFALVSMAMRAPPWLQGHNDEWIPRQWSDQDDALATEWLHKKQIFVSVQGAGRAAETIAKESRFHPIGDYLDGHKWDGTPRVATFATAYLGAPADPYHEAVSRCILLSSVARVKVPGCKADQVAVLEGEQGIFKSTAIKALFDPWFSDDLAELGTKDAAMQVRSSWCIEISELAAMRKPEVERVKAFVSRREDIFRPPFGARVTRVPRQSIFIGTTNAEAYLKDPTGARRFLPIKCGRIDVDAIKRDRDQIWAEALRLHRSGVPWWLNATESAQAAEEQEARRDADAWEPTIEQFIDSRSVVTLSECRSHLGIIEKDWAPVDQNRVVACLTALGWKRGWRKRHDGKNERCYRPTGGSDDAPTS